MKDAERLISAYLHEVISEEEADQLRKWLDQDEQHIRIFVREVYIHRCLYDVLGGRDLRKYAVPHECLDGQEGEGALVLDPREDPGADVFRAIIEKDMQEIEARNLLESEDDGAGIIAASSKRHYQRSFPTRGQVLRAVGKLVAIIMMALFVVWLDSRLFRQPDPIAQLTDAVDARWENFNTPRKPGAKLWAGPLFLREGFARIELNSGVSILVQAPAEFNLEDTGHVMLTSGVLTCKVSTQGRGFVLRTPKATVVDYGTEFGVAVGKGGQTDTHVFKGKVEMRTGSDPVVFEKSLRLYAGQGAVVSDKGKLSYKQRDCRTGIFIRDMAEVYNRDKLLNRNLIVNGDFEQDFVPYYVGETEVQRINRNIHISGWQDNCAATVVTYAGFPGVNWGEKRGFAAIPKDKGKCFFEGVKDGCISQDINLTVLSSVIDKGDVGFELSGWLGGWETHGDSAVLKAIFLDWSGKKTGEAQIGPITAKDRHAQTKFLYRKVGGRIPIGTYRVVIKLISIDKLGVADAYADNLVFKVFRGQSGNK